MKIFRSVFLFSTLTLSILATGCSAETSDSPGDVESSADAVAGISSETRKAIMNALRAKVAPSMGGQSIVFNVTKGQLKSSTDWVFLMGTIELASGGTPSLRGTAYEQDAKNGLFDGFRVEALLKKEGTTWKVVEFAVGSTDVWWDGIWTRYPQAPREIFPGLSTPVVTQSERMAIMGALRQTVKPKLANQDIVFNVANGHFKSLNGWCWLKGTIELRAGGSPKTAGTQYENEIMDGFHIEALLRANGDSWKVLEHDIGSTDVWYSGIAKRYPDAPSSIWDTAAR